MLWFILNWGVSELEFETDHEFYDPEGNSTVADFIRSNLEADHFAFVNSVYGRTYDAYFALYDGRPELDQDGIVRMLMDGADRTVADMVAQLTQERYNLTVKNYQAAMTATATMLVMRVPRAIRVYQEKRVTVRQREVEAALKDAPVEQQLDLLRELQRLSVLRARVLKTLGRVQ